MTMTSSLQVIIAIVEAFLSRMFDPSKIGLAQISVFEKMGWTYKSFRDHQEARKDITCRTETDRKNRCGRSGCMLSEEP